MKRAGSRLIVIGSSLGGLQALETVLSSLPASFPIPIALVQHLKPDAESALAKLLSEKTSLKVTEAEDKVIFEPGTVYVAPPNYHLLVERHGSFSLSVDDRENYARPSIDVLFESASGAFGDRVIGVILTGSNADGAKGLNAIRLKGGLAIVQTPDSAESARMPEAAIAASRPQHILPLKEIGPFLMTLEPLA